jgi:hypothetical protein
VQLETPPDTHLLKLSDLKPGMTAALDIRTRSRSVWQYLSKTHPKSIFRSASRALMRHEPQRHSTSYIGGQMAAKQQFA